MATTSSTSSQRTSITRENEFRRQSIERKYMSLRDTNVDYKDDLQFHLFVDALDLVEDLVVDNAKLSQKRRSFQLLLNAVTKPIARLMPKGRTWQKPTIFGSSYGVQSRQDFRSCGVWVGEKGVYGSDLRQ
ncbi:Fc.00g113460.m01.CDS01 [Cosmosporella sp. VM-42]